MNSVNTTVEKVDIDIDELFSGAVSANSVTTTEDVPKNLFSRPEAPDFSFTEKEPAETTETVETTEISEIIEKIDEEEKPKNNIYNVFSKLIKEDKLIPFDDDKPIEEYSIKDWQDLIEANLEERVNQVRKETPKEFFESLPQELQIAARYVADGGSDLKGLFATLAQVEESRELDVSNERDQELIIRDYLRATNYGNEDEISEEIELWKDLGKLEQQASKFKPKLDAMKEKIVVRKLQEQEMKKRQQENAAKEYMDSVYDALKDGEIDGVKLDKKTQSFLYNGLVQPNYPSVSGRNTNLLGHLLEKYQFVEPNYSLITEALWLLSDPTGYKAKIMEKGSQKAIESTVRKLKTEESNKNTSFVDTEPESKRKIQRPTNIFKRF